MYTMIGGATAAGLGAARGGAAAGAGEKRRRERSFMEKLGRPSRLLPGRGGEAETHAHHLTPQHSSAPSR